MPLVTPTTFAWFALAVWPIIAIAVYGTSRSRVARTTAWMIVLPLMFLPSHLSLKVSGVPGLDKYRIAMLSAAVALEVFHGRAARTVIRAHFFARVIMLILGAGVVLTVRTNSDPIFSDAVTRPALTNYDAVSIVGGLLLDLYLPFTLGERVFQTEQDLRDLFDVFSACALVYAPFVLFEVRFSPQLHNWIYGYYPSDWVQQIRGGGYRPMVFMNHGLALSMLLFTFVAAAFALHRARIRLSPSAIVRAVVGTLLVILSKSLGAIVFTVCTAIPSRFFSTKTMARVVLLMAAFVLAYPALRSSNLFPKDELVALSSQVSRDRAESLQFRFDQEQELIARAKERAIFGWGIWGRSFLYSDDGRMSSVPDGAWIIVFGSFGAVGFAGFFALLIVPLVRFWWNRNRMPMSAQVLVGILALVHAALTADLLPNSSLGFLQPLYAGVLFGLSRRSWRISSAPRDARRIIPHPATALPS